jgi:hypothetical protein
VRERTADCLGQGERESGQEGGRELRDKRREASGETMWRGRPRAATMLPGADAIPISFCPNISERTVKGLGFRFSADAMPMSFCPNISLPYPDRTCPRPRHDRTTLPGTLPGQIARSRADCPTDSRGATSRGERTQRTVRTQGAQVQMPLRCKCPHGAREAGNATNSTPLVSPSHAQLKSRSCAWYARACVKAEPAPHGDPSSPYRNVNALW